MRTRGYIDGIFGDAVRGWVVDLDDPATPVRVGGRFDGMTLDPVTAEEPRDDLVRAGIGAGPGGFRLKLGTAPGSGTHEIIVLLEGTTTPVPLAADFQVLGYDGARRDDVQLFEERDPVPIAGSPITARREALLAGEGDWLFSCPATDFDQLRGVADIGSGAVERLAARFLDAIEAATSGGLVAILPDKLFVYPERAPASMPISAGGRLAEQLAALAQDHDALTVVDLLPTLLRARAHGPVFSRTGLAPTPIGAFHAYRAIAKVLSLSMPGLRPCPVDVVHQGDSRPGDPAPAGVVVYAWHGSGLRSTGETAPRVMALEPDLVGFAPAENAQRPSVVVVHDPLSLGVAELVAAHGDPEALVSPDDLGPGLLATQRPDVLVWLLSDTALLRLASTVS